MSAMNEQYYTPQEVAQVILWLGSASPEYISGATVDVNSGSYPR